CCGAACLIESSRSGCIIGKAGEGRHGHRRIQYVTVACFPKDLIRMAAILAGQMLIERADRYVSLCLDPVDTMGVAAADMDIVQRQCAVKDAGPAIVLGGGG